MNTRLTKEDRAIIKEARGNKCSGPIYSKNGLRLLKVLGNPEFVEVEDGVKAICDDAFQGLNPTCSLYAYNSLILKYRFF